MSPNYSPNLRKANLLTCEAGRLLYEAGNLCLKSTWSTLDSHSMHDLLRTYLGAIRFKLLVAQGLRSRQSIKAIEALLK